MPSSIACSSRPSQPSPSTPPRFVVPTIMRLDPGRSRLVDRHVRQPQIGLAAGQAQLPETDFRAPERDAVGRLGRELVGGVADEQQIRGADRHGRSSVLGGRHQWQRV